MILEHLQDKTGKKYRWCNNENKPESDWFYDITDALTWIIKHDESKETNQKTV